MAVRAARQVKTFTVRFPGYGNHDETEHARLIARHFATEHIELEALETTVDLLPILARQFDEPIVDSSMIPTFLVSQLIRKHCTVALGGDGGDELFGGYHSHDRMVLLQKCFGFIPRFVRSPIAQCAQHCLPTGFKGRSFLQSLGVDFKHGLPHFSAVLDRSPRKALMARLPQWNLVAEQVRNQRVPVAPDVLQRITRMDFENYLAEDILVKVDRASMLNSLEVRAPLLDYRLIEFAFGKVPSRLKATATSRKVILKKLAGHLLPPAFDLNRKQGFSIPLASWLQSGKWQVFFSDVLLSSDSTVFDRRMVEKLLKGQARGRPNSERLFALVLFELWRREYKTAL